MNNHLNEIEIENYLNRGRTALSSERSLHLETCRQCRESIEEHLRTDQILARLKPLKADDHILKSVFELISETVSAKKSSGKLDWFFIGSIAALLLTLIITLIKSPLPGFIKYNVKVHLPFLDPESNPVLMKLTEVDLLPNISLMNSLQIESSYVVFFVGLIVFLFYSFLDKMVIRRIHQQ